VAHSGKRWNLGVVCGPSGLAVLDVDRDVDPDGACLELLGVEELPQTPIVRTGRGRLQLYFRDPGGLTKKTKDGFELRVGEHQCVAPPSVHPDTGKVYEWLPGRAPWDVDLADLPAHLPEWFGSNSKTPAAPFGEVIPEGDRNGILTSLAGTMRRRGMSETEIRAALLVTNNERCKPPLPLTKSSRSPQASPRRRRPRRYAREQVPPRPPTLRPC
jgi:putative DNA primase/helicase